MDKHTTRVGGADLKTNEYFNDTKWIGEIKRSYAHNPNGYQCVWWAFERLQEDVEERVVYFSSLGESKEDIKYPLFNRAGFGNGKDFYKDAIWDKSVDNPKPGDIVCYGSSWGGGYGHVRYVEKVEGNYMYLSGANENLNGGVKFNIKSPIIVGGGENSTGLQGYIHNYYFNHKEEEIDYKKLYEEAQAKLDKIKEVING